MKMYASHVKKELSAYCHDELAERDAQRVREHLLVCRKCRREFEEIKLGVKLGEQLTRATAPSELWSEIETLLDKHPAPAPQRPKQKWLSLPSLRPRFAVVALASMLVLAAGVSIAWYFYVATGSSFEVASLEGTPRVEKGSIGEKGRLGVGQWLETDSSSRAQIEVANIGEVEVGPNSRIGLVETRLTEHRLSLERGRLSARIWAPPKLFFVETPSATAIDYGCAYTLEVDDTGASLLHVTSGWVALVRNGRESMVPEDALCATRPGIGPGTPYFKDASETFRRALTSFDFEQGGEEAFKVVLAEARKRDTLTLWHLLARVNSADRERVYDRLTEFVAPPPDVTRDGVIWLDQQMLESWKSKLEEHWWETPPSNFRKAWRWVWK
jgi:hypothetical protein